MGVQLSGWNRYGHRRTYVNDDDGTALGYRDEQTGVIQVLVAERADDVRHALGAPAGPADPAARAMTAPEPVPAPARTASPRPQQAARRARTGAARHLPTLSEKALADELGRSPFGWAREVAWAQYRLDFYCAQARLAVEVDGSSHVGRRDRDAARDHYFRDHGIETLRVDARDVERDCASVVARINRACVARTGSVPATEVPARGFLARLLGRTEPVARPALAPGRYAGKRRGGTFVCARCRTEHPPALRSSLSANCCTTCAA